jgi:predicted nucleic acid-binding protein
MVLVDTSAWIEFLRDTGSPVCERVDALLGEETVTCHAVWMEVLAGARDERHLGHLRGLLARATLIPTHPTDYEEAAALYRACRRQGGTVRKILDCLIAALAMRSESTVLHCDHDFDVLARHTGLQVEGGR